MTQVKTSPLKALECRASGRELCRANRHGLRLWCRECQRTHLFSWAEIDTLHVELTAGEGDQTPQQGERD